MLVLFDQRTMAHVSFFPRGHWSLVWSHFDFLFYAFEDVEHVPNLEFDFHIC